MRLRATQFLCLAVLAAGVLAPPSGAASLPPEVRTAVFRLDGSNGYRVGFFAFSEREDGRGRIFVSVSRKHESAFYIAPAIVSEAFVFADLGPLGKVDLAVHPSGQEKKIDLKCSRQSLPFEPITYEGLVEFEGERGYTRTHATTVFEDPMVTLFCGGSSGYGESSGPGEVGARLRGLSFANGRRLSFQVNKNHRRAKTVFTAEIRERHDGIFIHRSVEGTVAAKAFQFDPKLRTAQLSPPAPFSGTATLTRDPDSYAPRWTGDLTLDFPGRPNVPLAGPETNVSLIHARFDRSDSSTISIRPR